MSQNVSREQLSALLDDELSEFEVRQLLQRENAEYQAFARWQLVKDVLKGQPVATVPAGFAEQLAQAVSEEKHTPKPQWWSGLAKGMVAASVAAATVTLGWQFWQTDTQIGMDSPVVASAEPVKESPISQAVRLGASTELVSLKPKKSTAEQREPVEFLGPLLRDTEASAKQEEEPLPYIHFIDITPKAQEAQR